MEAPEAGAKEFESARWVSLATAVSLSRARFSFCSQSRSLFDEALFLCALLSLFRIAWSIELLLQRAAAWRFVLPRALRASFAPWGALAADRAWLQA